MVAQYVFYLEYIFSGVGNHEFKQNSSYINCRDFAVIFAIITEVCRVFFNHFCRDFLLSLITDVYKKECCGRETARCTAPVVSLQFENNTYSVVRKSGTPVLILR